MTSSPLISILVPSYNQGDYIESTILSVLKQNYPNWELIIQDGDSKDNTKSICLDYEKKDPRIKFFSEKDKGFADAVNKAIDKAKGTIAAIQSSDDFYSNEFVFSDVVEIFIKHPQLNLLAGYHSYVTKELKEILCPQPLQEQATGFIEPGKLFGLQVHFPQSSTFFNLKRAREIKKLNTALDMVADTDFWIRMANYTPVTSKSIFRVEKYWSCVIVHENQRSVDQCQFSLGRSKMYYHYINDDNLSVTKLIKTTAFRAMLVDALGYFHAQQRDTTELRNMFTDVFRKRLPLRWTVKEFLNVSPLFRKWLHKNNPERSSLELLKYPNGKIYNWMIE